VEASAGILLCAPLFCAAHRRRQLTVAENKFSLEDRLQYGNLEVNEVCELKPCSRSKIYQDRKAGLVEFLKAGSRTLVRGPVAKKYISGEPIV
jgi:hypothetical protein